MKKSKFTQEEVNAVMEARGINRKSALKFLNRDAKTGGRKAAPAVDVKKAAANDKSDAVPTEPKTEVGAARSEGLRLYKLAGRPTKAQFIKVYGKRGHLMTWDQRAEAGVPAAKFQAALAEKQGK
jgi:hypothetical protein